MIEVLARAKVNLGLEIVGRRPDGYHEVVTILQEVSLADRLVVAADPAVRLTCDDSSLAGEANLVVRAARLLQEVLGEPRGVAIALAKRIPVAAGLGGGSSDAAAALRAIDRLWGLGLDAAALRALAGRLGADVPFFVRGGTQLATGRGETLQPLPTPTLWLVLLPASAVLSDKTRRLYSRIGPADWSDGSRVREIARSLETSAGLPSGRLVNAFQRAALDLFPEVRRAIEALERAGAAAALCGAGPSVFSVHPDEASARAVGEAVERAGLHPRLVSTVGPATPLTDA